MFGHGIGFSVDLGLECLIRESRLHLDICFGYLDMKSWCLGRETGFYLNMDMEYLSTESGFELYMCLVCLNRDSRLDLDMGFGNHGFI